MRNESINKHEQHDDEITLFEGDFAPHYGSLEDYRSVNPCNSARAFYRQAMLYIGNLLLPV